MARIKIKDLPRDTKISREEMKGVLGGQTDLRVLRKITPQKEVQKDLERLMNQLQNGIEAIMDMQDTVIKTNEGLT